MKGKVNCLERRIFLHFRVAYMFDGVRVKYSFKVFTVDSKKNLKRVSDSWHFLHGTRGIQELVVTMSQEMIAYTQAPKKEVELGAEADPPFEVVDQSFIGIWSKKYSTTSE